jgi:hypothetical protein
MDRTPIQVLFIEDSEVDVELALHSLDQGGFEVSWDRVDAEVDLKRALGGARRTQAHGELSGGRVAQAGRREIQLKAQPTAPGETRWKR